MARAVILAASIIAAWCLPTRALADDDANPWTFNAYFENDLFNETDQQYTNGVRLSWISGDLEKGFFDDPQLPQWVKSYSDRLRFFHDMDLNKADERIHRLQRNMVISVGQLMYTPESVEATEVVQDDRPYAGFLYLGMGYHTRSNKQLDTIELNLGVVGPWAHAKETQDFVHRARDIDVFKGWDNQLRNELGLQAIYEHKHRVLEKRLFSGNVQQDMIWHAGFSLGNVATYLNLGAEYRIGLAVPNDFGTAALRPGGDSSAPGAGDRRLRDNAGLANAHLFLSVDSRAVARDIFLDGNTFRDSHSVEKKHFVYDVAVGVSFTYHRWKFSYAEVYRSREYSAQKQGHTFGSLSLSYSW